MPVPTRDEEHQHGTSGLGHRGRAAGGAPGRHRGGRLRAEADARAVAGQATQQVFIAAAPVPAGTSADETVAAEAARGAVRGRQGGAGGRPDEVSGATGRAGRDDARSRRGRSCWRRASATSRSSRADQPGARRAGAPITVNLADPQRIAPLLTPGAHIVIYDTFNPRRPRSGSGIAGRGSSPTVRPHGHAGPVADVHVIAVGGAQAHSPAPAPSPAHPRAVRREPRGGAGALVTVALPPTQATPARARGADRHALRRPARRASSTRGPRTRTVNDVTVVGK